MSVQVVQFLVRGREGSTSTLPEDAVSIPAGARTTHTVVYDGFCTVCRRLARALHEWDRDERFEILPSQTPGLATRFPWIPARAYAEALQLVEIDGTTWQGSAAIEEIIRTLPKGKAVAWLFAVPLVRPIADRIYRWFARNRRHLGCGQHCAYRPEGDASAA